MIPLGKAMAKGTRVLLIKKKRLGKTGRRLGADSETSRSSTWPTSAQPTARLLNRLSKVWLPFLSLYTKKEILYMYCMMLHLPFLLLLCCRILTTSLLIFVDPEKLKILEKQKAEARHAGACLVSPCWQEEKSCYKQSS